MKVKPFVLIDDGQGGFRVFSKKVIEVPVEFIMPGSSQPRTVFGDEELMELAESIKKYGIIQPVILKKEQYGTYTLIAGERRTRAAVMAGLKKVPAIIRDDNEKDAAILSLVENVQRENLSYIEEATAYKRLMDEYGFSQQEIAKHVGKKQSTISNKIRLLALPEEIIEELTKNRLTERHARALLKITDSDLRKLILKRVVDNELNVRQTEKLIEDMLSKSEEEKRRRSKICYINYKVYLNSIRRTFGEISQIEKNAKFFQEEKEDFVEVRILIPKNREAI